MAKPSQIISGESGKELHFGWVIAIAILPLLGYWTTGLFDLDEGFYGAVVSEMLYRQEWITPFYNGTPWFEKPILLYWAAMPTVALFGESLGPRMPSVLANLALYWLIFKQTKHYLGEFAARLAVIALSTSLLMVYLGRAMMTDALLTLALSCAFLFFYRALQTGNQSDKWIAAAALGFSVLAKGPVGGALFLIIFGLTYRREVDLRSKFRGGWLLGICIFTLVVGSWYLPSYLVNRELFVQEFLIKQNYGRFTGGDQAHTITQFWGYFLYIPIILLGTMPWSLAFIRRSTPVEDSGEAQFIRFCWRWFWTIFIFFSISKAKLPHYIMPLFPPLAMIAGFKLKEYWSKLGHNSLDMRVARAGMVTSCVVALLFGTVYGSYYWKGELPFANPSAPQGEAHQLIHLARDRTEPIVAYQLSRRQKELGTGKASVQETTLPSLTFYAHRPIILAETMADLPSANRFYIFTRHSRVTPAFESELAGAGYKVVPISLDWQPTHYTIFEVERMRAN